MVRSIRTYSDLWLRRHRETHAKQAVFGTHRHPYLLSTIRAVAAAAQAVAGALPSLLDYGCGKGVFVEEMRRLGRFADIVGFDPALDQFKVRPTRVFDVVTCLDVLDQLEDRFVGAAIEDVAQFAGRAAVFSVITRQSPQFAHLRPRSALVWRQLIERHLRVTSTEIRTASEWEIAMEGACPERVIIVAAPRWEVDG